MKLHPEAANITITASKAVVNESHIGLVTLPSGYKTANLYDKELGSPIERTLQQMKLVKAHLRLKR